MQLISLVYHLQVADFCFYNHLHPGKKVLQLVFIRNLVHQYIRFDKKARLNISQAETISGDSNRHCKYYMKSCSKIYNKCNFWLRTQCFAPSTIRFDILSEIINSDKNYKTCSYCQSYKSLIFVVYFLTVYIS